MAYRDLAFSSLEDLPPRGCLRMEGPASHHCSCWHICVMEPGHDGSLKIRAGKRLENRTDHFSWKGPTTIQSNCQKNHPKAGKTLGWRGRSLTGTLSQGECSEDVFLLCQACSRASVAGMETFLFSSCRNGPCLYIGFLVLVHYYLLHTDLVNSCCGGRAAPSALMALILPSSSLAKAETLKPGCGCW